MDKLVGISLPIHIMLSWLVIMLSAVLKLEHFNKVFDVSDVIFGIIPEQFGANSRPLSVLFFLYIILTSINTVAILGEALISTLEDTCSWASKSRILTTSTFCFTSFLLGLIFLLPNGYQLLHNTTYALETASVLYIIYIVSIFHVNLYHIKHSLEIQDFSDFT